MQVSAAVTLVWEKKVEDQPIKNNQVYSVANFLFCATHQASSSQGGYHKCRSEQSKNRYVFNCTVISHI